MKKILVALLLCATVLSLVACGGEKTYSLGMGTVATVDGSTGTASMTVTTAAVVLSPEEKIVACRIDVSQDKLSVADGKLPALDTLTFQTKAELGNAYGMTNAGSKAEWYVEVRALEEYLVGKTKRDLSMLPTKEENGGVYSTDDKLTATCTIDIGDMLSAVKKAVADTQKTTLSAEPAKLGLAFRTSAADSTAASEEKDGRAVIFTTLAATALDADGKILGTVIDAAQGEILFDTTGAIGTKTYNGTKRELKENYGMSAIGKTEWYLQAKSFADFTVGMNGDGVGNIPTEEKNGKTVAADSTLYSGCTIDIAEFKNATKKAVSLAR